MKTVYRLDQIGWVRVYVSQSFDHACAIARKLSAKTGVAYCVNN